MASEGRVPSRDRCPVHYCGASLDEGQTDCGRHTLSGRGVSWDDLPPQPWPEVTEPTTEALADWLLSLSRDQLLWLLDTKRQDWSKDARCFIENHDGLLRQAQDVLRDDAATWQRGYDTGFEDAKARALEVVLHDHK